MLWIILAITVSYLIGSIPTAYLFGRLLKGMDIRKFGSGNVGATNAFRVLGVGIGITVLILDMFKGFLVVFFLGNFILSQTIPFSAETLRLILGLSCIAGHNWTIFLGFKGGKGIATTLGVLIALASKIADLNTVLVLIILTWVLVFILAGRIVSLASVVAAITFPVYTIVFKQPKALVFFSFMISFLIILRHKSNLKKFFRREEKKLF